VVLLPIVWLIVGFRSPQSNALCQRKFIWPPIVAVPHYLARCTQFDFPYNIGHYTSICGIPSAKSVSNNNFIACHCFITCNNEKSTVPQKMPKIKLISSDNQTFSVDLEVAMFSGTIRQAVDDVGLSENSTVPLSLVNGHTLKLVLAWLEHYKKEPAQMIDTGDICLDNIPEWDKDFLNVSDPTLFSLINAANYLDLKGLLQVCCKTLAKKITGKNAEQLREDFGIENDYTPEEEAAVRKENQWIHTHTQ
jgi:S-phase kinase-associated protein 1